MFCIILFINFASKFQ